MPDYVALRQSFCTLERLRTQCNRSSEVLALHIIFIYISSSYGRHLPSLSGLVKSTICDVTTSHAFSSSLISIECSILVSVKCVFAFISIKLDFISSQSNFSWCGHMWCHCLAGELPTKNLWVNSLKLSSTIRKLWFIMRFVRRPVVNLSAEGRLDPTCSIFSFLILSLRSSRFVPSWQT